MTAGSAGLVGLLTLASAPASAAGHATESATTTPMEITLDVLAGVVPGLRALTDGKGTAGESSGESQSAAQDAVVEEKPEPQALVKPDWKYPAGDLPKDRAVPIRHFWISAPFGNRGPHTGGIHSGLDFAADEGTPIFSVTSGKVVQASYMGAAGNAVIVRTKEKEYLLYGHLSKFHVRKGQRIKAGKEIGHVGSTGNSTGPHLHFQVRIGKGGNVVDPQKWLRVSQDALDAFGSDGF